MKARLDEEMGAPPAGGVDVDALMALGRRQVRRRRLAAVGGGVGLSAVALGAAVAVAVNGKGTGGAPAGFAGPPSASASPSASPSGSLPGEMLSLAPTSGEGKEPGGRVPQPDPTPQTADEKRMSGVVKALVQQYAPGATAAKDGSGREALEVRSALVYRNGTWVRSGPEFEASADLTVGGGTGNFYIGVGRRGDEFSVASSCAEMGTAPTRSCSEATGRNGEKIVKLTERSYGGTAFIVYITRTDGTGVALIADDGSEHNTRVRSLDEPVFSQDELVRMGTDPRVRL